VLPPTAEHPRTHAALPGVCATWRAAVLSIPHLVSPRFALPLNCHANAPPFTWDPELLMRMVVAPPVHDGAISPGGGTSEGGRKVLVGPSLMASTQYISVGLLYRYLV
jgi:hypothetical protein